MLRSGYVSTLSALPLIIILFTSSTHLVSGNWEEKNPRKKIRF